MSAPGSARIISPSMAKLAVTPPVVGSVSTGTYKSPASECRFNAADVFAICIRETIPSCILAPPEQQNRMTGRPSSVARSTAQAIFSPITCPMLLIRNLASQMPSTVSSPYILQRPMVTASCSPVFSFAAFTLSSYPGNSSGFASARSSNHGVNVPASATMRMRFLVRTLK